MLAHRIGVGGVRMGNTMVWLAVGGLLLVGCQKTAPANEDSANAAKPQVGF